MRFTALFLSRLPIFKSLVWTITLFISTKLISNTGFVIFMIVDTNFCFSHRLLGSQPTLSFSSLHDPQIRLTAPLKCECCPRALSTLLFKLTKGHIYCSMLICILGIWVSASPQHPCYMPKYVFQVCTIAIGLYHCADSTVERVFTPMISDQIAPVNLSHALARWKGRHSSVVWRALCRMSLLVAFKFAFIILMHRTYKQRSPGPCERFLIRTRWICMVGFASWVSQLVLGPTQRMIKLRSILFHPVSRSHDRCYQHFIGQGNRCGSGLVDCCRHFTALTVPPSPHYIWYIEVSNN